MAAFWVAVRCSLVEVYRPFGGLCYLNYYVVIALEMETRKKFETLINKD